MRTSLRVSRTTPYAHVSLSVTLATLSLAALAMFLPHTGAADPAELRKAASAVFKPLPDRMPGAEKDTPALVALGKTLYFDKRLSQNNSQSCNSCHAVDDGKPGVDNEPTSPGAFGKRGGRNSPTSINAGMHVAQFWDGRAATLEDQAKGPVLNPVEMAMPNEAEVLARLKAAKEYGDAFKKAFPGQAEPFTYDNVAAAVAAFERTLVSHDRFDDFLKGQDTALTAAEQRGLKLFLDVGCTTCHNGPLIGANAYQKVGLVNPYENTEDKGRSVVTKDEDDDFKFKVPSLRNIELTYPYFHDGRFTKLHDVVKKMGWMQLGKELAADEVEALTAFLKTLSGKGLKPAKPAAGA